MGAEQINFNNAAAENTLLDQITFANGAFTSVPTLRNQVGADMVALLALDDPFSARGLAWVNGESADFAYSVTKISVQVGDSVFAHEIGHNMGSGHEHAAVSPGVPGPCESFFRSYACGHGNSAAGWGTIMSRLNDEAVGFRFSNLDSDCFGQPCGVPAGQANPADNRLAFNESRRLIANFRRTVIPNPNDPASNVGWLSAVISLLLGE